MLGDIFLPVELHNLFLPASLQCKLITVICAQGLRPPGHPSLLDSEGTDWGLLFLFL